MPTVGDVCAPCDGSEAALMTWRSERYKAAAAAAKLVPRKPVIKADDKPAGVGVVGRMWAAISKGIGARKQGKQ